MLFQSRSVPSRSTGGSLISSSECQGEPLPGAKIKWGSATRVLPSRPTCWRDAKQTIRPVDVNPSAHDVMIGRIVELHRHKGIEQDTGRKSQLYPNDLVGVAFGHRYATRQFEGDVPPVQPVYHMLSQGGVCGRVVSAANNMDEPTLIEPLGYLVDERGKIVNLQQSGLRRESDAPRVQMILAVGSSMDSGKTHMAASIVHGLTAAGRTVNAGKLTGTACAKDTNRMFDAGALRVLDFNDAGFCSTFRASERELSNICETLISNLSADSPDYLVLEIADGVIQQETRFLLTFLLRERLVDHVCVAVHDALAGPTCLEFLGRNWGIEATLLSGIVTRSPLSTAEVASLVDVPCLPAEVLVEKYVEQYFLKNTLEQPQVPESDWEQKESAVAFAI